MVVQSAQRFVNQICNVTFTKTIEEKQTPVQFILPLAHLFRLSHDYKSNKEKRIAGNGKFLKKIEIIYTLAAEYT